MTSLLQSKFERRAAQRASRAPTDQPPGRGSGSSVNVQDMRLSDGVPFVSYGDDERLLAALAANAASLRCLRVSSRLLRATVTPTATSTAAPAELQHGLRTALVEALAMNTTLRSLEVTREAYVALHAMADERARSTLAMTASATASPAAMPMPDGASPGYVAWTNMMRACYDLPLRTLQLSGLGLSPAEVEQALRLVAYVSGTGDGSGRARPPGPPSVSSSSSSSATAAAAFSPCLATRPGTLEFLDLSRNALTPTAAAFLHDILYHPHCSLKRVCLNECHLGDDGAVRLFCSVEQLVAGSGRSAGAAVVSTTLAPRLEVLELRWNGLTTRSEPDVQLAYVAARVLTALPRTMSADSTVPVSQQHLSQPIKTVEAPTPARTTPLVMYIDEGNRFSVPAHRLLSAPAHNDQLRRRVSREAGASTLSMGPSANTTATVTGSRRVRPPVGPPSGPSSARTTALEARPAGLSPLEANLAKSRTGGLGSPSLSASSNSPGPAGGATGPGISAAEDRAWWRREFVSTTPLRQRLGTITPSSSPALIATAAGAHARGEPSCVSGVTTIGDRTTIGAGPLVTAGTPFSALSLTSAYHLSTSTALQVKSTTTNATATGAKSNTPAFAFVRLVQAVDQRWTSTSGNEGLAASVAATGAQNRRSAVAAASSGGLGLNSESKHALRRARRTAAAHVDDVDSADDPFDGAPGDIHDDLAEVNRLLATGTGPAPPHGAVARFPLLHLTSDLLQRHAYWHAHFRNKQQKAIHAQTKEARVRVQQAVDAQSAHDQMTRETSPAALGEARAVVQLVKALGPAPAATRTDRLEPYANLRAVASMMTKDRSS